MPTPTLITDLSITAAANSPSGSDSPATLDDIQRAHGSFIAQLAAGTGFNSTTGTGAMVRATSPTLITPALGTPTSGTLTNVTGLPPAGVVGTAAILGTNTFTAAQNLATGASIASAATINLDAALDGNRHHITGTTTITAVTLTRGPRTVIFDGVLTLTHNALTNNLPSAANIITAANDRAVYEGDGTTVYCTSYTKASGLPVVSFAGANHEVYVNQGNGNASTNIFVRRYLTTVRSVGTAITYADSATDGASFTINQTGLYSVFNEDSSSVGQGTFCIGVNATPTAAASAIALVNTAVQFIGPSTSAPLSASCVVRLVAGDVLRPFGHTTTNTFNLARTIIRLVAI